MGSPLAFAPLRTAHNAASLSFAKSFLSMIVLRPAVAKRTAILFFEKWLPSSSVSRSILGGLDAHVARVDGARAQPEARRAQQEGRTGAIADVAGPRWWCWRRRCQIPGRSPEHARRSARPPGAPPRSRRAVFTSGGSAVCTVIFGTWIETVALPPAAATTNSASRSVPGPRSPPLVTFTSVLPTV